ncbi:probable pectate lyase P59 [Olea europaea subsp. europaea]|uniref:Probable pectate lyase P59 n=1 Tax=Olea europaea subsp. europaea TaxID=158383 RepID=A0A8S0S8U1_OLEEU|nr:probable pectate lyase P59 [Olea europaea subsp. europaea]
MSSDKTINRRGAEVHIAYGVGITIQFVRNVILHGARHIHDIQKGNGGLIRDSVDHYGYRIASEGDDISIFGSQDVWIDHIFMRACHDGLIDVMLFGASDGYSQDEKMQVAVAFNPFGKRLVQRKPRCRYGYIHVVNNDYSYWNMYAIDGSQNLPLLAKATDTLHLLATPMQRLCQTGIMPPKLCGRHGHGYQSDIYS